MRSFMLFTFLLTCISCSKEDSLQTPTIQQGMAYVESTKIPNEIEEVLSYSGISSYGKHRITLNTNNSNYFFFAAAVDIPAYQKGKYSSNDAKLSSYKTFDGCFFYELCKDSTNNMFVQEAIDVKMLVDYKTSSILNNDSLYLSLNGRNYVSLPEEMTIGSYQVNEFNDKHFSLAGIVPLFSGSIRKPENKDNDVKSNLLVGLISYDRTHQYDFDAMFHSSEFASRVAFTHMIETKSDSGYPIFRVSDFIIDKS